MSVSFQAAFLAAITIFQILHRFTIYDFADVVGFVCISLILYDARELDAIPFRTPGRFGHV